jgi:hypothetical protein
MLPITYCPVQSVQSNVCCIIKSYIMSITNCPVQSVQSNVCCIIKSYIMSITNCPVQAVQSNVCCIIILYIITIICYHCYLYYSILMPHPYSCPVCSYIITSFNCLQCQYHVYSYIIISCNGLQCRCHVFNYISYQNIGHSVYGMCAVHLLLHSRYQKNEKNRVKR